MIDWLLILAGGLLGSAHCVGMCGPIVVTIGSTAPSWPTNLRRQSGYHLGRLFCYTALGAIAGFTGDRLTTALDRFVNAQSLLAVIAGLGLVGLGLGAAGLVPWPKRGRGSAYCLSAAFFEGLFAPARTGSAFLTGVATGFLPCGLVHAFLTLAASTSSMLVGAVVMGVFCLGTIPALLAMGCGGMLVSLRLRRQLFFLAVCSVTITGLVTLSRGVLSFTGTPAPTSLHCPLSRSA
jgi:sulfite exporter TauE/SafE